MYLTHFIPTKWPRGRTNANIGLDHPHTHSEPHFLLSPPKVYLLNSIVNELPYKLVVKPNNSCGCRYAVSQDPLTASLNKNWINKWNKCVTSLTPSRSPSMRLQGKPSDFIYRQTFEAELKGAGGSPLATNFKRLALTGAETVCCPQRSHSLPAGQYVTLHIFVIVVLLCILRRYWHKNIKKSWKTPLYSIVDLEKIEDIGCVTQGYCLS